MKIKFNGKVLVIGCGSVAQCFIPLLVKHVDMPTTNITIIDFVDNREKVAEALKTGINYTIDRITKENMHKKLYSAMKKTYSI